MSKHQKRLNNTSEPHYLRSNPILFCTPAQAGTLISEGRSLLMFVRHGLTDWNMQMRLQGRENIPLNDEGKIQADEIAYILKTALESWKLNGVYTSPLSRAKDTAAFIATRLGYDDSIVVENLIERDYSTLSGLTLAERKKRFPFSKDYPTDMESVADAAVRMKKVALELCFDGKAAQGATIAVTHGGVINSLFSYLTRGRAGVGKNVAKNCSISICASGTSDIIPLAFNLHGEELIRYVNDIRIKENN